MIQRTSADLRLNPHLHLAESAFGAPRDSFEAAFRFGAIGDTATGHIPEQIADQLLESGVDLAIHTGDVVHPDGADDLYDQEFFRPMARWLALGPVLPALGNHDIHTNCGASAASSRATRSPGGG